MTRSAAQVVLRRSVLLVFAVVYAVIGTNLLYLAGSIGRSSEIATSESDGESEESVLTIVATSSCGLINCCCGDVCAGCCCASRIRDAALFGRDLLGEESVPAGHRIAVEFGLPVYQAFDGPQLETDWFATIGWQFAWH